MQDRQVWQSRGPVRARSDDAHTYHEAQFVLEGDGEVTDDEVADALKRAEEFGLHRSLMASVRLMASLLLVSRCEQVQVVSTQHVTSDATRMLLLHASATSDDTNIASPTASDSCSGWHLSLKEHVHKTFTTREDIRSCREMRVVASFISEPNAQCKAKPVSLKNECVTVTIPTSSRSRSSSNDASQVCICFTRACVWVTRPMREQRAA